MSWLEGRKAPTLSFGEVREPVLYPPCGILRDSGPRPRRGSPTGPRPCQVGLASTPTPLEKHKFSSLHFLFSSFVLAPLFLFRSVLARASLSSSLSSIYLSSPTTHPIFHHHGRHQAPSRSSRLDRRRVFLSVLFSFSVVFLPFPYSLFCYQCMSQTGRVVRLSHMARPRGSGLWPYPRACSS